MNIFLKTFLKTPIMILLISILLVVSLPSTAQASTLYVGATGPAVRATQTELNSVGYSVGTADGIFGPLTKQGVVKFQNANGLTPDGIVGPKTEAALTAANTAKLRQMKTNAIINTAKSYIGVPYLWGGTTPKGFDCSGFAQFVFAKNGITLQRVSEDQAKNGNAVSYSNLQPGDLMFFSMNENGDVSHVGIYLGNGQFIGSEAAGVRVVTLDSWWQARFVIARRVY